MQVVEGEGDVKPSVPVKQGEREMDSSSKETRHQAGTSPLQNMLKACFIWQEVTEPLSRGCCWNPGH